MTICFCFPFFVYSCFPLHLATGCGASGTFLMRIFVLFLALAGTLAFTFCVVETYVLVRGAELPGGSASLVGVLMIVSEVLCFWFSNHCLKAGPFNVTCMCLALYTVRMESYAVLPRETLFLQLELLHGVTYSMGLCTGGAV